MTITDNFGMGLMQTFHLFRRSLGHNGAVDGFQTRAFCFLQDKTEVTYMTNGIDLSVEDVMDGVLRICFGLPYKLPEFRYENDSISTDFGQYTGVYTSPGFPLEITITEKDHILTGQASGQPSFDPHPYALHKFSYAPWGVILEFIPAERKMILKQKGSTIIFTMKK